MAGWFLQKKIQIYIFLISIFYIQFFHVITTTLQTLNSSQSIQGFALIAAVLFSFYYILIVLYFRKNSWFQKERNWKFYQNLFKTTDFAKLEL